MPTKSALERSLEREVRKLIARHNRINAVAHWNVARYKKRSAQPGGVPSTRLPRHWAASPAFNPFYVRARLDTFAYTLSNRISDGTYSTKPRLSLAIEKPDGGSREISIFTIPDAAVSYWLGNRLVERNAHFLSSYSYAYRSDRNVHHAIQNIMRDIRGKSRVYVLEYDFSRYFDSIRHEYVLGVARKYFKVTSRELAILDGFLKAPKAMSVEDYLAGKVEVAELGIPQGTTISLFLANVACYELDREIEALGVAFARYADDTIVICQSYEKAHAAAGVLLDHGLRSGTSINFVKSAGISLLTPDPKPELRGKLTVEFLGHSLSPKGVGLAEKSVRRIKRRVSTIIYNNLLLQPKRGRHSPSRVGSDFFDWDLVTCVNELRRYIYGGLSEFDVSEALAGAGKLAVVRSAMSFYPTVDFETTYILRDLDGWLCDAICRAHAHRSKLLRPMGIFLEPVVREKVIDGSWYSFPNIKNETRLPSFFKSWAYNRKCVKVLGLTRFPSPKYEYA